MNYAYSPHTGELIHAESPADWMRTTSTPPPAFDPALSGCFWRGDKWEVVAATPDPEKIKADLTGAVQMHLDAAARVRGYDDIRSAVTYADEPAVAQFQADGKAMRAWRSLVWQKCYEIMADVEEGERAIPAAAELVAELPGLVLL